MYLINAYIVSSKQKCHKFQRATGMNFSQPLCIQQARKIYTSNAITFLNWIHYTYQLLILVTDNTH
ncbi:MAG TPA: hypothetical protein DC010_00080 [Psychrobacter sp.]|nr:hypothetical protein [Psychrobacter sp.]